MAIARLDAAASVAAATQTFSVSAGSNRMLVACFAAEEAGPTEVFIDSVDYGGQAMVEAVEENIAASAAEGTVAIYYLLEAGIAAATDSVITPTYSKTPGDEIIAAISYTGVDQTGGATTNPAIAQASAIGTTPNPLVTDLTETDNGCVVACNMGGNASSSTWHADMTEQTDQTDTSSHGGMADRLSTTSGNVNIEATIASQNRAAQCAASFAPSATTVALPGFHAMNRGIMRGVNRGVG